MEAVEGSFKLPSNGVERTSSFDPHRQVGSCCHNVGAGGSKSGRHQATFIGCSALAFGGGRV
eukprot:14769496-Alexandrium_andersonii.AAC.1